jgi:hypothetical protein
MVLGRSQVQRYQLIALTGVLQGALICRLDPHLVVTTADATGALLGFCIDVDRIVAISAIEFMAVNSA